MRQVLAEALEPIHPVILLEVPSVTLVPVFLPVLGVTLAVPLPLLFLSLLPLSLCPFSPPLGPRGAGGPGMGP